MGSYQKRVEENLAQMSAPASEWRAVPTIGEELADAGGREKSMPLFAFPEGYAEAPTLYKASGSQCCCGLCGEDIKNVFWIQNDAKLWTMPVGSECVTHFADGLTGEKLHAAERSARATAILRGAHDARIALFDEFATFGPNRHGIKTRHIPQGGMNNQAIDLRRKLRELVGEIDPDTAAPGVAVRWRNAKGDKALALMESAQELIGRRAAWTADEAKRLAARASAGAPAR